MCLKNATLLSSRFLVVFLQLSVIDWITKLKKEKRTEIYCSPEFKEKLITISFILEKQTIGLRLTNNDKRVCASIYICINGHFLKRSQNPDLFQEGQTNKQKFIGDRKRPLSKRLLSV